MVRLEGWGCDCMDSYDYRAKLRGLDDTLHSKEEAYLSLMAHVLVDMLEMMEGVE